MKKLMRLSLLSFLCLSFAHIHADNSGVHVSNKPLSLSSTALKVLGLAGFGSIVYTYLKTPQEVVPDHNNVLLNFFDNTWCGNWQMQYGGIIDGNRIYPYAIPARGVIGKGMKYFWPAVSMAAILGAWYGAMRLAPLFFSIPDTIGDKAAHAIVGSIPGARIVRMDG